MVSIDGMNLAVPSDLGFHVRRFGGILAYAYCGAYGRGRGGPSSIASSYLKRWGEDGSVRCWQGVAKKVDFIQGIHMFVFFSIQGAILSRDHVIFTVQGVPPSIVPGVQNINQMATASNQTDQG